MLLPPLFTTIFCCSFVVSIMLISIQAFAKDDCPHRLWIQDLPNTATINIEPLPDNQSFEQGMCISSAEIDVTVSMDGASTYQKSIQLVPGDNPLTVLSFMRRHQWLTETINNIPISKMIEIPGGDFEMGCQPQDDKCEEDEKPLHEVSVPSFLLGATEVTFEQYDHYCNQVSDCELPEDEGWGRGQRPVINVSWQDAQKYIQWLNAQNLPGGKYRLPSESEWEYAARAGTRTQYFWGNQPSNQHGNGNESEGWPDDGYTDRTAPVGSYEANAWGLYDMSGNVWEWCEDRWHSDYQGAPDDGSAWVTGGNSSRVLRGGSWNTVPYNLRSGYRNGAFPSNRFLNIGFRLAQDHSL